MRRDRVTVVQIVLSGLFSVLLAVSVNVATGGRLPGPLQPFAGLAWPLVGLLAVTITGLALWQHRHTPPAPDTRIAQLPAPRPVLGRAGELRSITRSRASAVLITGVPGSGKTSLALRAAHDLRGRFADGQLYADLRGSDPDPVAPGIVLVRFLRALEPGREDPSGGTDELAARFRSAAAGRRLLILLDDAGTDDQVTPLLPGAGRCLVLITSRRLLAPPDGQVVPLGELSSTDGRALLAAAAGAGRVTADPAGADRIVAACAGLPLAVQLAGARLRARPGWTLQDLAGRLDDEQRRLGELRQGDAAVRGTFRSAYQALAPREQLVFRRAGAHPGKEFTTAAATALTGLGEPETAEALDRLADATLVQCPAPDRFRLHDLLRLYAFELFTTEEPAAGQAAALDRLLAWLTAQPAPDLDDVVAAAGAAVLAGRHAAASDLAETVLPTLTGPADHVWRLPLAQAAATAAAGLGDDVRLARAMRWTAHAHRMFGDLAAARPAAEQCAAVAERSGDASEIARCRRALGETLRGLGLFDETAAALNRAIDGFAALGRPVEQLQVQTSLAGLHNDVQRPGDALKILEATVPLLDQAPPSSQAWVHLAFAVAYRMTGRDAESAARCDTVTAIAEQTGDDFVLGYCHQERGWLAAGQGRYADAEHEFRRMRDLMDGIRHGTGVGAADDALGRLAHLQGRHRDALRHLDAAVGHFDRIGDTTRADRSRLARDEARAALGER